MDTELYTAIAGKNQGKLFDLFPTNVLFPIVIFLQTSFSNMGLYINGSFYNRKNNF